MYAMFSTFSKSLIAEYSKINTKQKDNIIPRKQTIIEWPALRAYLFGFVLTMVFLAIVFGIGSYTYNMNTRDTFGFALKTTYGVVNGKELMLYKDPITDDGTKKSQKGMVSVFRDEYFDELMYRDEYTKKDKEEAFEMRKAHPTDEHYEMLQTVFLKEELEKEYNLQEIRDRLKQELVFDGRLQYASR